MGNAMKIFLILMMLTLSSQVFAKSQSCRGEGTSITINATETGYEIFAYVIYPSINPLVLNFRGKISSNESTRDSNDLGFENLVAENKLNDRISLNLKDGVFRSAFGKVVGITCE